MQLLQLMKELCSRNKKKYCKGHTQSKKECKTNQIQVFELNFYLQNPLNQITQSKIIRAKIHLGAAATLKPDQLEPLILKVAPQ